MFDIMFIIVPVFIVIIFILVLAQMISPKFRGKIMSRQIKATKYMMGESKKDIKDISTTMADATKDGVEITTRAIKNGWLKDETMYCKYCGHQIDSDSIFCKHCGKEQ